MRLLPPPQPAILLLLLTIVAVTHNAVARRKTPPMILIRVNSFHQKSPGKTNPFGLVAATTRLRFRGGGNRYSPKEDQEEEEEEEEMNLPGDGTTDFSNDEEGSVSSEDDIDEDEIGNLPNGNVHRRIYGDETEDAFESIVDAIEGERDSSDDDATTDDDITVGGGSSTSSPSIVASDLVSDVELMVSDADDDDYLDRVELLSLSDHESSLRREEQEWSADISFAMKLARENSDDDDDDSAVVSPSQSDLNERHVEDRDDDIGGGGAEDVSESRSEYEESMLDVAGRTTPPSDHDDDDDDDDEEEEVKEEEKEVKEEEEAKEVIKEDEKDKATQLEETSASPPTPLPMEDDDSCVDKMELADAYDDDGETSSHGLSPLFDRSTNEHLDPEDDIIDNDNDSHILSSEFSSKATTVRYVMTPKMKKVLETDLGYSSDEITKMKPDVAAVIIQKKLHRPDTGMPEPWYVEDRSGTNDDETATTMRVRNRERFASLIGTATKAIIPLLGIVAASTFAFKTSVFVRTSAQKKRRVAIPPLVGEEDETPSTAASKTPVPLVTKDRSTSNDAVKVTTTKNRQNQQQTTTTTMPLTSSEFEKEEDEAIDSEIYERNKLVTSKELDETWLDKVITFILEKISGLFNRKI